MFATEALLNEHGKSIAGQRFVIQVHHHIHLQECTFSTAIDCIQISLLCDVADSLKRNELSFYNILLGVYA